MILLDTLVHTQLPKGILEDTYSTTPSPVRK
jgi:hypothetical protein